jgi:AraC-like DNA-binding protein
VTATKRKPKTAKPRATAKDGKPDGRRRKPTAKRGAGKAAEKTARTAKAAGATGRRLPAAKQRLRDSMIAARAAQGWTNKLIAAEAKVSEGTVERVLRDQGKAPSPLEQSPVKIVNDLLQGLAQSVGDFEAMSAAYVEVHPSAAVGAKRQANEARAQVAAICQALGHVPDDLRKLRVPLEAAQIGTAMVDAIEQFELRMAELGLDDEAKGAVFAAAEALRGVFAEFVGDDTPALPAGTG